jgi:hypothetical protein
VVILCDEIYDHCSGSKLHVFVKVVLLHRSASLPEEKDLKSRRISHMGFWKHKGKFSWEKKYDKWGDIPKYICF